MGHEFSGTVEQIGSQVTGLKIGDRVTAIRSYPAGNAEIACQAPHSDRSVCSCFRPPKFLE
ncbi:alcohol dehydrogenase catalytic domain-containing protein [Paenibacillaceae bacterium T2]|uniref:Alcohol dehydrogenase catalytic domain-containing protein n=2 Tax=Ferviditalea candida TaxID=3108399 RepID=A0ABU5ZEM0_9BACL|nr:alcohol dehydrogenase catalytic domain-containing protein [Paenibacillaceae bacterium T2]